MKKRISLLFVLILLIFVSFIGCQKDIRQLDYVNILVNHKRKYMTAIPIALLYFLL